MFVPGRPFQPSLLGTLINYSCKKFYNVWPRSPELKFEVVSGPAIGVEDGQLVLASLDDVWVAVADVADVVDAVQELGSGLIVHILTYAQFKNL